MRLLMLFCLMSFSIISFAYSIPCPTTNQVATGKFINVYQNDKDTYMLYGFFAINNHTYQKWGLMIYDYKSNSIPGALLATNTALKQQQFSKVTDNAVCSGGNQGNLCQCTYQINVTNDGSLHHYKMYAEIMS